MRTLSAAARHHSPRRYRATLVNAPHNRRSECCPAPAARWLRRWTGAHAIASPKGSCGLSIFGSRHARLMTGPALVAADAGRKEMEGRCGVGRSGGDVAADQHVLQAIL